MYFAKKNQQIHMHSTNFKLISDWSQYYHFLKITYLESMSKVNISNDVFIYLSFYIWTLAILKI